MRWVRLSMVGSISVVDSDASMKSVWAGGSSSILSILLAVCWFMSSGFHMMRT